MKQSLKHSALALALLAALLVSGCAATGSNSTGTLKASGLIEATEVSVAPELSGRVTQVSVAEGDTVKAGAVLFQLDDSLLQMQRKVAAASLTSADASVQTAQAAVNAAQAQYDNILSQALAASQQERSDAWDGPKPAGYDLPNWYYSQDERYQSAQAAVDTASQALDTAQADLESVSQRTGSAQFIQAEKRLSDARQAFELAQDLRDQVNGAADGQYLRDASDDVYDDAKTELDDAQKAYDDSLTTDEARDVLKARAKVAVAQERYDLAQSTLRTLQVGAHAPEVVAAASALEQAQAALEQAKAQVTQAQAQLDLLDLQIEKLTVRAPQDGTVLTRSIQPGEVIQAGMAALSIANLDQLKVTVYIPEDRYGEVVLGSQVSLSTDSFPGETFSATVTRIADHAEFTPQNVQTTEGRQTTVYAVELTVDNPDARLKPGMPVDVDFNP